MWPRLADRPVLPHLHGHTAHDGEGGERGEGAGDATHDGTGTAANRGLGALDLDRTQGFDGTHTHGLHAAGFVTSRS